MNPQFVTCECGVRLKVPYELAQKARSVKCPKCTSPVDISGLSWSSSATPASPAPAPAPARPPKPVAPRPPVASSMLDEELDEVPRTKDCIYCGEKVMATAVKCRHCGEFFDTSKAPSRAAAAKVKSGDEPNPAEYFVALLIAPIGLIIGLIWAAKKQAKAKGMLMASGLSSTIIVVVLLMLKLYVFTEDNGPMAPSTPIGGPTYVVIPGNDGGDEPTSPPNRGSQSRPTDVPGKIDLDGLPATIQRAMKANVRIEGARSLGSGVVIQRMEGEVLILTNHHVVTESPNLNAMPDLKTLPRSKIVYFNEQSNPGTVIWIAPDGIDLALVKAPAPAEIEPVTWKGVAKVVPGEELFAVGNPLGLSWSFTKGVASALRQEKHGNRDLGIIQSDTKTTFGNSGGGLYNTTGELIGINSSIVDPRLGGISFAIRPQILVELKPEGLNLDIPGA